MIENNKLSVIVGIILGIPLLFISIKMLKKVNYESENPENYDNDEPVTRTSAPFFMAIFDVFSSIPPSTDIL